MFKQKQAFTLVELIVVITILAILGTIAFISLQGYSKDSRDSVRISDLSSMKTSLELFHLDAGKYPETTDIYEVKYSGVTVWNQGYFGDSTYANVGKLDEIPTDPLTDRKYIYSVTSTKQEYEIAGIIEGDTIGMNIGEVNAGDKIATLKITGNYNGKFLKVSTGGIDYVLNVPSLITSTGGTLDYIINNNGLAYDGYTNLPLQYDGSSYKTMGESPEITLVNPSNIVAYSGSFSELSENSSTGTTARTTLITNAQDAYTGTEIANEGGIKEIVSVDTGDSDAVESVATIIVSNDLGGDIEIVVSSPSSGGGGGGSVSRFPLYDEVGTLSQIHLRLPDINMESIPEPINQDILNNQTYSTNNNDGSDDFYFYLPSGKNYADIRITSIVINGINRALSGFTVHNGEYVGGVIRNTDGNENIVIEGHYTNPDNFKVTFTATELTPNDGSTPDPICDYDGGCGGGGEED